MREKLYIESESGWPKTLAWGLIITFLVIVGFFLSGMIFLSIAHFMFYGLTEQTAEEIYRFWLETLEHPQRLKTAYEDWFYVFLLAARYRHLVPASFVPFLGPLLFAAATLWVYVKSPSSFKLWYRLKNHYAKPEDVEKMGVLKGVFYTLGKYKQQHLKLQKPLSVFVWGGEGLGKSSCVSLPSVLDTDNACLAVADSTGGLAKYSSGYRSRLGKVFYFNWALTDAPEKGEFWPRWNPLSPKDMPVQRKNRQEYIRLLVKCLYPVEQDNFWEQSSREALEGLLLFFVSKTERAMANDYFLSELLENGKIAKADRALLESYYQSMDYPEAVQAVAALREGKLNVENYLPVGSWENVPELWRGKEFCLPMFVDCLMLRYFVIMQSDEEKAAAGGFKIMLGEFMEEARIFGYNTEAIQTLQRLYDMSRRQRRIIFTMLMSPLAVFRKSSIRQRTSLSDFSLKQLRGIKEGNEWKVTTLYTMADAVKSSGIMSRFLLDMLIGVNLRRYPESGPFPLGIVLDDFERLPKLQMLTAGLMQGKETRMSFMMLTDGMFTLQNTYGVEGLEDIIGSSAVKLMMAENSRRMSEHFNKLAVYGVRTVQIPAVDAGAFYKVRKGLADANYYRRIAADILAHPKTVTFDKSNYLLLVEGFYHLPVNIQANNFLRDDRLKKRAACGANYLLDSGSVQERNVQDVDTPDLVAVMQKGGINIEKEEDVDIYLKDKYDEVVGSLEENSGKDTVLGETVEALRSAESFGSGESETARVKSDDWWLDEEAFTIKESGNVNPFEKAEN